MAGEYHKGDDKNNIKLDLDLCVKTCRWASCEVHFSRIRLGQVLIPPYSTHYILWPNGCVKNNPCLLHATRITYLTSNVNIFQTTYVSNHATLCDLCLFSHAGLFRQKEMGFFLSCCDYFVFFHSLTCHYIG